MNKVVDYMLAGKYIVAQYTGYPSFINEAAYFYRWRGLVSFASMTQLPRSRAKRDAIGLAGFNMVSGASGIQATGQRLSTKIEECVDAAS